MKPIHAAMAAVLIVWAAGTVEAAASLQSPSFELRNGVTEAQSDIQQQKPVKLYSHVFNGRVPGFSTPGLLYCNLSQVLDQKIFVIMDEASFQEGYPYTEEQWRSSAAAIRFATDYNRTIFQARTASIREICPQAREAP